MAPPEVRPVRTRREARTFLELPYLLNGGNPNWVPPLRMTERQRWQPKHNASLRRLDAVRLVAWRGGEPLGRIAAIVDPLFDRWASGSGFFGFFECADDPEVCEALLAAAEEVLRGWGCSSILGPVNHTTHEEVGFLVDGFSHPPSFLAPYNPPFYPALVQQAGYGSVREYLAFEWTPATSPRPCIQRLARSVDTGRGIFRDVRIRPFDSREWDADIRRFHHLYNDSFRNVWGFVEASWEEFSQKAKAFRTFYRPELALLAERGGEPLGFALILPDVNTVLTHLGGRLFPFGWLRARREIPAIRTGRFILIGVRPGSEGQALAPAMVLHLRERVMEAGLESVEVSLVQAANEKMLRVVEGLGCRQTKVYRLFGKDL